MDRRHFLSLTVAAATLPLIAHATPNAAYTPDLLKAELAAGKTVFLDFFATWCTTCAAQRRVIDGLKAANPAYEKSISFLVVDWDTWSSGALVKQLNIPRRSTLVVLKGDKELGRIVAGTAKADIQALMDTALQAAVA